MNRTTMTTIIRSVAWAIPLSLIACATPTATGPQIVSGVEAVEPAAATEQAATSGAEPVEAPAAASTFDLPPPGTNIVGDLRIVVVRYEDTLLDIARRHDLGYKEITDANPEVDPWLPGEGTRVVLPTQFVLPDAPRKGIVLNISAMRLFYYPTPKRGEQQVVITHPIAIGREGWNTPLGVSRVIEKIVKPTWRVPVSIRREHARDGDPLPPIVRPGPDNPLGEYAMRLSNSAYLIHGTNQPSGIGMRASHGCLQLYPEDIARMFRQVPLGTPVQIVDQPYLVGRRDGMLYLKAHKPEDDGKPQRNGRGAQLGDILRKTEKRSIAVDWTKAKRIVEEARGIPVPILAGSADLTELLAAASEVPTASSPPIVRGDTVPGASTGEIPCASCSKVN